jgi:hypothetical protein
MLCLAGEAGRSWRAPQMEEGGVTMRRSTLTLSFAAALALGAVGLALAQAPPTQPPPATPPPPAAAPKAGAPATVPPVQRQKGAARKRASTPEGIACSAEADAKGLKGPERRSFRRRCIAEIRKGALPAQPGQPVGTPGAVQPPPAAAPTPPAPPAPPQAPPVPPPAPKG